LDKAEKKVEIKKHIIILYSKLYITFSNELFITTFINRPNEYTAAAKKNLLKLLDFIKKVILLLAKYANKDPMIKLNPFAQFKSKFV
tara:strand:- start:857 stop:1117 length:261 start_codon:yes stop_codon:yes gene_type:complete